jgi:hypothetical protein
MRIVELEPDAESRSINLKVSKKYPAFEKTLTKYLVSCSNKVRPHREAQPDQDFSLWYIRVPEGKDLKATVDQYYHLIWDFTNIMLNELPKVAKEVKGSTFIGVRKIKDPLTIPIEKL